MDGESDSKLPGAAPIRRKASAICGHTTAVALDPETAVLLEQRDTRRGRRGERAERTRNGASQGKGEKLGGGQARGRRDPFGGGAHNRGGFRDRDDALAGYGREGAVRHAAVAALLAAAAFLHRQHMDIHGLHLRHGGAEGEQEEPGESFHAGYR